MYVRQRIKLCIQYNLSNPACYQTEKKIRIRQGAGKERLTYPRDIKVTLVSIGIQHTADNGYVNLRCVFLFDSFGAVAFFFHFDPRCNPPICALSL